MENWIVAAKNAAKVSGVINLPNRERGRLPRRMRRGKLSPNAAMIAAARSARAAVGVEPSERLNDGKPDRDDVDRRGRATGEERPPLRTVSTAESARDEARRLGQRDGSGDAGVGAACGGGGNDIDDAVVTGRTEQQRNNAGGTDHTQHDDGTEPTVARPAHGVPTSSEWVGRAGVSADVPSDRTSRCLGIAKPISVTRARATSPTVTAGIAASVKPVGVNSPPEGMKIVVGVVIPRATPISREVELVPEAVHHLWNECVRPHPDGGFPIFVQ